MKIIHSDTGAKAIDPIAMEAASWIAQIDLGKLSDTDRLALAEWMARSPRHTSEIRDMAKIWGGVDAALDAAISQRSKAPSLGSVLKAGLITRPVKFTAAAACALMLAISPLAVSSFVKTDADTPSQVLQVQTQIYAVPKGGSLIQTLDDGSIIQLNTDTQVEVTYTPQFRRLKLVKGEAFFDVAHDANRPFEVYAGQSRVQALGTAFVVSLVSDQMDVTVTEGKVRVDKIVLTNELTPEAVINQSLPREGLVVPAGHQAKLAPKQHQVAALDIVAIEKNTAWRKGQFVFSGDTLEEIVNEMTRYSDKRIVISDPNLRSRRMAGVFSTSDIDPILSALSISMDVKVDYVRDDLIYLSIK